MQRMQNRKAGRKEIRKGCRKNKKCFLIGTESVFRIARTVFYAFSPVFFPSCLPVLHLHFLKEFTAIVLNLGR